MDELHEKKNALERSLREMGSAAVAFSAGVDSTFLLKVAHEVLGERAVAVTVDSRLSPREEMEEARRFCEKEGVELLVVPFEPLDIEGFRQNPANRCYICKRAIFTAIRARAAERGLARVVEGSNTDDDSDYRPGMAALAEKGIASPLREAGLGKAEIRLLSREMGLATWDKPSYACLATRFVHGETVSAEKLAMVERAEREVRALGPRQVRVRVHGKLARIELPPEELPALIRHAEYLDGALRALGFDYVTLDLGGYRMGSMNRTPDRT
ncbi:MAG: ATP-dependent sacrificial sulfur transferase LarE [Oscillospiraceae bacterium]|nr:ATP-dependent sacrificial sulfur transferase LarE [Oscillospiraceae bacterium]